MSKNRLTSEDRRLQIIRKAAEVFSLRGAEGTRTRDIAEACGINEALLYKHFQSKDDLYREAMVQAYDEAAGSWIELAKDQPDGLHAFVAVLKAQLTTLSENPKLCANMWHGVASTTHDPIMHDLIKDRFERYHRFLKDLIAEGIRDGSVKPDLDPDLSAWSVRGVVWTFILRVVLDLEAGETAGDPVSFCRAIAEGYAADPASLRAVIGEVEDREAAAID